MRTPLLLYPQILHHLSSDTTTTHLLTLSQTKQIHALLITTNTLSSSSHQPLLLPNLLRSYSAHGATLSSSHLLFLSSPHPTTLLYNSLIRAHAKRRHFSQAFSLFSQLRLSITIKPDGHTFACLLRASSENADPPSCRALHGTLIPSGFVSDRITSSALVSAYSKLGLLSDACRVFDGMCAKDLVLWNSMMMGYGYAGFWREGIGLFERLRYAGEKPDGYTLVGLVSCFSDPDGLRIGRGVHGFCVKGGLDCNDHVRSALVTMYSRCECLDSAYRVFEALSNPDLITWSALITGFSQARMYEKAFRLFRELIASGRRPDSILIASILSACAALAAAGPCKELHCCIVRLMIDTDIAVSCALVDAYAKCGFAQLGFRVFEMMQEKNLVAYNVVISALGSHGDGSEAIRVFDVMLNEGFKPDKATFSALLCACCHAGLEHCGWRLFHRMQVEFQLEPGIEHYVYMVKLLGMAGELQEAYDLIQSMPMPPESGVLGALLWGCSMHGNSDLGAVVARRLLEIEPSKTAYRVMLSNIYASKGKWEDVKCVRDEIVEDVLQKIPGCSWIGDD